MQNLGVGGGGGVGANNNVHYGRCASFVFAIYLRIRSAFIAILQQGRRPNFVKSDNSSVINLNLFRELLIKFLDSCCIRKFFKFSENSAGI